jgi:hypothetical protein
MDRFGPPDPALPSACEILIVGVKCSSYVIPMRHELDPIVMSHATATRSTLVRFSLAVIAAVVSVAFSHAATAAKADAKFAGVSYVDYFGYTGCIRLENESAAVVLCHQAGGRVLEYSLQGKNSMWLDPKQEGWVWQEGAPSVDLCGGRLDIGPEMLVPRRPALWLGAWRAEAIGPRAARLTSAEDPATGVQLVRDFKLDATGSRLICTQTIRNVSQKQVAWCHWSRTLAVGGGICVIPVTPHGRFPNQYVMYEDRSLINPRPVDPNIRMRDGFLEIIGPPKFRKLGMDSQAGWFAYAMPNDVLFVKRYRVYPEKLYGEVAGLTISIWYDGNIRCELEPIGPLEHLKPGATASFTEEWELKAFPFPAKGESIDLQRVAAAAKRPGQ